VASEIYLRLLSWLPERDTKRNELLREGGWETIEK
jgi:hypothetical protein